MEWDFKIGEDISYFDMNKSYELTKYRPITEDEGLDFNPEWFNQAARDKNNQGVYTTDPPGSKAFIDFWNEQVRRCKEGYESHGYRITGYHYFFLNFYKLLDDGNSDKASSGRNKQNPDFWSKHYEYFHYIELSQYLGFDCCTLKSRGVNKPALQLGN